MTICYNIIKLKLFMLCIYPTSILAQLPLSSSPKINFHSCIPSLSGFQLHRPETSVFRFCLFAEKIGTNLVFVVGELYRKILPLPHLGGQLK